MSYSLACIFLESVCDRIWQERPAPLSYGNTKYGSTTGLTRPQRRRFTLPQPLAHLHLPLWLPLLMLPPPLSVFSSDSLLSLLLPLSFCARLLCVLLSRSVRRGRVAWRKRVARRDVRVLNCFVLEFVTICVSL